MDPPPKHLASDVFSSEYSAVEGIKGVLEYTSIQVGGSKVYERGEKCLFGNTVKVRRYIVINL